MAFDIIQNLPEGYECRYLARKGVIEDHLKKAGMDYVLVDKLTPAVIRREAKAYGADILHANDFTASVLSPFACPDIPVISHLHSNPTWMQQKNLKSLAFKLALPRLKKVILVSDSIRDEYVYASALADKAVVLGNPFSVKAVIEKAGAGSGVADDGSEGADSCKYDLLYCGRLTPEKNPLGFLKIVDLYVHGKNSKILEKSETTEKTEDFKNSKILEFFPRSFGAVMIGDGELREECEKYIKDNNLSVEMLGFQENPYKFINQARVVCMPSVYEGFGLVALEAMCLGKPVLASGAGGLSEIVNDTCGRICGDIEEYVQELDRLFTDPAYYADKSEGAVRRADEYDNLAEYIEQIVEIYDSCAKCK